MQMRGNIRLRPSFFILFYLEIVSIFSCATIILVIVQMLLCVNAERNYICVKGKSAGTVSMYDNIKFHTI